MPVITVLKAYRKDSENQEFKVIFGYAPNPSQGR